MVGAVVVIVVHCQVLPVSALPDEQPAASSVAPTSMTMSTSLRMDLPPSAFWATGR